MTDAKIKRSFEEMKVEELKRHIGNLGFSTNSLLELAKFIGRLVDEKVKKGLVNGRKADDGCHAKCCGKNKKK